MTRPRLNGRTLTVSTPTCDRWRTVWEDGVMTTSNTAMTDNELEAIRSRDLLAEVDRLRAQVQRVEALAEHWLYEVPSARYSSRELTAALDGSGMKL